MYWLKVKCSMSDPVLATKKSPLSRGLLSDIGCLVQKQRMTHYTLDPFSMDILM